MGQTAGVVRRVLEHASSFTPRRQPNVLHDPTGRWHHAVENPWATRPQTEWRASSWWSPRRWHPSAHHHWRHTIHLPRRGSHSTIMTLHSRTDLVISATMTMFSFKQVSQATLHLESKVRQASRTSSETWSQIFVRTTFIHRLGRHEDACAEKHGQHAVILGIGTQRTTLRRPQDISGVVVPVPGIGAGVSSSMSAQPFKSCVTLADTPYLTHTVGVSNLFGWACRG